MERGERAPKGKFHERINAIITPRGSVKARVFCGVIEPHQTQF
jgi:hypothetical protein